MMLVLQVVSPSVEFTVNNLAPHLLSKAGNECYGYYKTITQYTGIIIFKTKLFQFNIKQ